MFRKAASAMTSARASTKSKRQSASTAIGANTPPGLVTKEHLNSTSTLRRKRMFTRGSFKNVVRS